MPVRSSVPPIVTAPYLMHTCEERQVILIVVSAVRTMDCFGGEDNIVQTVAGVHSLPSLSYRTGDAFKSDHMIALEAKILRVVVVPCKLRTDFISWLRFWVFVSGGQHTIEMHKQAHVLK